MVSHLETPDWREERDDLGLLQGPNASLLAQSNIHSFFLKNTVDAEGIQTYLFGNVEGFCGRNVTLKIKHLSAKRPVKIITIKLHNFLGLSGGSGYHMWAAPLPFLMDD